jgi:hypothetical protein
MIRTRDLCQFSGTETPQALHLLEQHIHTFERHFFKAPFCISNYIQVSFLHVNNKKLIIKFDIYLCWRGKAIIITGHGGLQGSETSRISHCLDNRLKDGGEIVTARPDSQLQTKRI